MVGAGEAGAYKAFRLLEDCYANGFCDVAVDPEKAARWRDRMEEYHRLNPPRPRRHNPIADTLDQSAHRALTETDGVIGLTHTAGLPGGNE